MQIPNSLPRKSLNTDSLISCKFHLKFLQNNCQEISSPSSSYFCFSLRLLCTVHTRDFDLFYFMTLVLQNNISNRWVYPNQFFFHFLTKFKKNFECWILKICFLTRQILQDRSKKNSYCKKKNDQWDFFFQFWELENHKKDTNEYSIFKLSHIIKLVDDMPRT